MAKTREEYQQELASLRANAEESCRAYNLAISSGNLTEAARLEKAIDADIEEHSHISELLTFDFCANSDDPMRTAVTLLTFNTIARKDAKEPDAVIQTRSIVDKSKYIDLKKLHKRINGGIGHDPNWIYMIEQFNMRMTAQRALALGYSAEGLKEINDSYAMSKIAEAIDLGKNPCSGTQMLKTLQTIVTAMIGEEYKCTSHDVAYLKSIYAKKGKEALSVACANHSHFRQYIAEICHRIVLSKTYTVLYKAKKQ